MKIKEIDIVAKQKSPVELVKAAKLKNQRNKRKASAADFCVSTHLFCLAPSAGKAVASERLFKDDREASVDIAACVGEAVAHAEEKASDTIGERRPLPGTQKFVKSRGVFSWTAQAELPWLPWIAQDERLEKGIRFPKLWADLPRPAQKNANRAQATMLNPEKGRPASTCILT